MTLKGKKNRYNVKLLKGYGCSIRMKERRGMSQKGNYDNHLSDNAIFSAILVDIHLSALTVYFDAYRPEAALVQGYSSRVGGGIAVYMYQT